MNFRGWRRRVRVSDTTVYIIGVLISVIATIVTLAVTWIENFSGFEILTATALIFIAGSLVVLMIETRRRADRNSTLIEVMDFLARRDKVYTPFKELGESLVALIDHYPHQPELDIAWQTAMDECNRSLNELAQGHLEVPSGDATYKRAFLDRGLQLRTTSLLRADLSFWKSEEGEQYWEEQLRALRFRQQKIERIFICDVLADEVRELMNEHAKAGVVTYIAYEADLSRDDRVDITLWGDEVLSIQRCLQKPLKIGKWYDRFSVHPDEVERAERQYRRILQVAELWDVN